jgi:hypothetical protein
LRFESWRTPDAQAADHHAIASGGKDRKFEKRSLRDYSERGTTDVDCDIVFRDGKFISYPAELQVKETAQKPSDPDSLFKEATSLYWSQQYDRAIPLFINYLKDRPHDALANGASASRTATSAASRMRSLFCKRRAHSTRRTISPATIWLWPMRRSDSRSWAARAAAGGHCQAPRSALGTGAGDRAATVTSS